jgi:predicted nucleic acid-binding Zn ribbon protein
MTDRRKLRCPTCGKTAERIISGGAGLVFKGSGFYATDYKRAGVPKSDGDKSEKEAKPKESKPASDATPTKKKDSTDK